MWEALVVLGLLALLVLTALANGLLPWVTLLRWGVWGAGSSLIVSVGAGLVYHMALWRALGPRHLLPPGWWWNPTRHHGRLSMSDRPRVLVWFYAGAASFTLVIIGCALVLLAIWRSG